MLEQVEAYIQKARLTEPRTVKTSIASAQLASIRGDLAGMIKELTEAWENGFRNHWDLVRVAVYDRWQDNAEFLSVYQHILGKAEEMRNEYKANNPIEFGLTGQQSQGSGGR